ncbi:hypothetical protein AD428_03940 [Achromobacter sp. DMS1]|nr:hypothetical protein AD428_03940 [Achromobacter sp. DMS1]
MSAGLARRLFRQLLVPVRGPRADALAFEFGVDSSQIARRGCAACQQQKLRENRCRAGAFRLGRVWPCIQQGQPELRHLVRDRVFSFQPSS